jgi:AraC-like DNA-binding protein
MRKPPPLRAPTPRLRGPLGLSIERGGQLSTGWRTDDEPALVLPLGSSVVQLRRDASNEPTQLDRSSMALVPCGARYRLHSMSPATELLTLFIGAEGKQRAHREYQPHIVAETMEKILTSAQLLPRTRWFDELAQRYLFERNVCFKHTGEAAMFLETELTKELYFLGAERLSGHTRVSMVFQGSDVVSRARRWIEDHLFERFSVADLAKQLHTSEATLLRAFLRDLDVTPAAYQRGRKLEEAVLLLRAGDGTVGDVAKRVGYANLSAFTVAFRRQFGVNPSTVRGHEATGAAVTKGDPLGQPRRRGR